MAEEAEAEEMRLQRVLVGMLEIITAGQATTAAARTTGGDTAMGVTRSFVPALACVEVGTTSGNDQRISVSGTLEVAMAAMGGGVEAARGLSL